ncbi:radical SAM protein [Arthrobacter bambusae]
MNGFAEGKVLSLITTHRCNAACKHCGTLSNPHQTAQLTLNQMTSAIAQAAKERYAAVVFTGGEPTLIGPDLRTAITFATDLGLSTRVVSNAHWAISDSVASKYVADLHEAGLVEINYSTGDQHSRFVSVQNVIRAAKASLDLLMPTVIMVELVGARKVTRTTLESDPLYKDLLRSHPSGATIFESPWMPLTDRKESYPDGVAIDSKNLYARTGCDSILETTTVQADGSLIACCGLGSRLIPELNIGSIDETPLSDAVEMAENDFVKRWLKVEGPEHMLAWAAGIDSSIEWEGRYAHRCQACLRLFRDPAVRKVVREHHREKIADVMFKEWLLTDQPRSAGDESQVTS